MEKIQGKSGWRNEGPALHPADISKFESQVGLKLPEPVVWLLSNVVNGGFSEVELTVPVALSEGADVADVHGMFGIGSPSDYDLEKALHLDLVERLLPYAFPIGFDSGDGHFFVRTAGEHKGEVIYSPWDEFADSSRLPELYFVAKDIGAFVEILAAQNEFLKVPRH